MKKHETAPATEGLDDLDVFEELEAGDTAEPTHPGETLPGAKEAAPELDDDFVGFEDEPQVPPKPIAKAPAARAEKAAAEPTAAEELADELTKLAPDLPVNLAAVVGKKTTNVGDLMKCRIGQVIDLGRPPGETVDVVANGRLIARGELVEMDGKLGVRILKMVR